MFVLSGSSYSCINMNSYYEHSLNYFAKIFVDNNLFVSPPKGPAVAPEPSLNLDTILQLRNLKGGSNFIVLYCSLRILLDSNF